MAGNENIIYCADCDHCFKCRRSKTGYSCEVWGHDDFACDVPLDGFCFKAKSKTNKNYTKFTCVMCGKVDYYTNNIAAEVGESDYYCGRCSSSLHDSSNLILGKFCPMKGE